MSKEQQSISVKQNVIETVASKIKDFQSKGEINFPQDYSPDNALKSAWLKIIVLEDKEKKLALEVCTQESIANALLTMVIQGLNIDKYQGYFLIRGNKLIFQRSYFGSIALAKMVDRTIEDIPAEIVYDGDVFEYHVVKCRKEIVKHAPSILNVNHKKIVAAYAQVITFTNEIKRTEIMTFDEIKQAWKQSPMYVIDDKGNIKPGSVHDKFTADMTKKTVINKVCKYIINSSNDKGLLFKTIGENEADIIDVTLEEEINQKANTIEIDI